MHSGLLPPCTKKESDAMLSQSAVPGMRRARNTLTDDALERHKTCGTAVGTLSPPALQ